MIKIMIDSTADCKDSSVFDYFVPMTVLIDGVEYMDGVNLDVDTFYKKLPVAKEFPQTSQPSPGSFLEYFKEVKENGDELIYFAVSSGLSGTIQSATLAKQMVDYEGIYIVDSVSASHMIEMLAVYARALIQGGFSAKEIVEKCENVKARIRVYAGVDTLEYLQKGGRIGKAAAFVGGIANIKPLITVSKEGTVDALGKALGFSRAVQTIVEKVKSHEIDENFPMCSLYTFGEENCEKLENKLVNEGYTIAERQQVGPTIGTHTGPGIYGVYFVEKEV